MAKLRKDEKMSKKEYSGVDAIAEILIKAAPHRFGEKFKDMIFGVLAKQAVWSVYRKTEMPIQITPKLDEDGDFIGFNVTSGPQHAGLEELTGVTAKDLWASMMGTLLMHQHIDHKNKNAPEALSAALRGVLDDAVKAGSDEKTSAH